MLVLILAVLVPSCIHAADFSVKYGKEVNGKFVNSYSVWNRKASSGQTVSTPKVSDRSDGTRCYWIIDNQKGAACEIECGDKFKVTRSVNMYAVWKRPKASYKAGEFCIRYGKAVNGKFSNVHETWNRNANLNQVIKLPSMHDRDDGTRCCWLVNNKAGTEIVGGRTYVVRGDTDFYVVWKKIFSVKYLTPDGKSELPDLRITACDGEKITLPSLKNKDTAVFSGWKLVGSSTVYKAGAAFTITKSVSFQAVFKTCKKAVLKDQSGKVYKEILLTGGEEFPSVWLSGTKTLQGWSRTAGKTNNPEFLEEDTIPDANATYYMVVYDSATENEPDYVRESTKYGMVYFVGDSRINRINISFGKSMKTAAFIGAEGKGYAWLTGKDGGYDQLVKRLGNSSGKRAVVFCLGVNDLKNIKLYISFYKEKAQELKKYGCDLYIMSVNPFCREQRNHYIGSSGTYKTSQKDLKVFNNAAKTELSGLYTYIDVCSFLRKNGWATSDFKGISDGLHYSGATNKKIINKTMELIG